MKEFDDIFLALDQIGIVIPTETGDSIISNAVKVFDVQPGQLRRLHVQNSNVEYKGKHYEMNGDKTSSFITKFPVELEYVIPADNTFSMGEFLEKKQMGIHHIRFSIRSQKDAVEYMAKQGIGVLECGDSVQTAGVKYTVFDSCEKLGFYIETLNTAEFE